MGMKPPLLNQSSISDPPAPFEYITRLRMYSNTSSRKPRNGMIQHTLPPLGTLHQAGDNRSQRSLDKITPYCRHEWQVVMVVYPHLGDLETAVPGSTGTQ